MSVRRLVGGLMLAYAALYLFQYLFSALYDNPQRVWDVMNVLTGIGVLVALAVNLAHVRSLPVDASTMRSLGAHALGYASAVLVIWFFHNWIRLLILEEGQTTSTQHEVVWQIIAVMVPLVLGTTGWRLWRER